MPIPDVVVLRIYCAQAFANELSELLLESGAAGVEHAAESDGPAASGQPENRFAHPTLVVHAEAPALEALEECARTWLRAADDQGEWRIVRHRLSSDWALKWTYDLEPVQLTPALQLVPVSPGTAPQAEPGQLFVETGIAFGYGEHPTTRLMATWLSTRCQGKRVLDFGTGTGVLAMASVCHGAEAAVGLDIDEGAISVARRSASLNELGDRCRFLTAPLESLEGDFGVVVANVDVRTLCEHAEPLCRTLRTGGELALSGFLKGDNAQIVGHFARHGVNLTESASEDDWMLLSTQTH